ncbi:hypothetical protein J132_05686 [Termitomyces sp. J132]|nr:hypothetical protein J132_05686 [Termitomyces sp. J132]
MRFNPLFAVTSLAITGVIANPLTINVDTTTLFNKDLSADNHYGAPIPPWAPNHKPGWYYGTSNLCQDLLCLNEIICSILNLLPLNYLHCPAQPLHNPSSTGDGYTQTFSGLTGAIEANDYLTYGLVDTVAECKAMCNSVSGCVFVNTYHDVNGKGGSTQLTCALFSMCHSSSDANNDGGQTQSDGSINYIVDSDGWCKNNKVD